MLNDFCNFLKNVREERKLSINQLALYSGVSASHISRIERGLREPSPEILEKLAPILKVPYSEMLLKIGIINENIKQEYMEQQKELDHVINNESNKKIEKIHDDVEIHFYDSAVLTDEKIKIIKNIVKSFLEEDTK